MGGGPANEPFRGSPRGDSRRARYGAAPLMASKPSLLQILALPRTWLLVVLGFSSGLPLLLLASTLSAWMTNEGVNLKTIGVFSLVSWPYVVKFVWAPLMDRYAPPFLGRRRGWMLLTQVGLGLTIAGMGLLNPRTDPLAVASLAVVVAFLAASQDIVSDAWRTDTLSEGERAFGTATFIVGYRIGMLAAGGVALALSDVIGWANTYGVMGALMAVGVVGTLLAREPESQRPPRTLVQAVTVPFVDYFSRKGSVLVLCFLLLYKLGDAIAGGMTTPFYLKTGFSNTEVGAIIKGGGLVATLAGGILGGALLTRLSMRRGLFIFGALQSLTNLSFLALALMGKNYAMLVVAICVDNVCGGMADAAMSAFTMALCNKRFSATQFALITALSNAGGRLFAASSGFLAVGLGWPGFFGLTVTLAVPALVLLTFLPDGAAVPVPEEALPAPLGDSVPVVNP